MAHAAAAPGAPTRDAGARLSVLVGAVFVVACVAALPVVYHLVRADPDARLAPFVIAFAGASMIAATAGGLAIERKAFGVAAALALVIIAQAPILTWAAGNVDRFAVVPPQAVTWAWFCAAVSALGLAVLGALWRSTSSDETS